MSASAPGRGLMLGLLLIAVGCGSSTSAGPDGGETADAGGQPVDAGPPDPSSEVGDGVRREAVSVGGVDVDRYTWTDSVGQPRSVSLKKQGAGNGGYAVQITYQTRDGAGWRTVTAQGTGGGEEGFGYFVAHERDRTFDDNSTGTIAALHGEDDSPLGVSFPVTASHSTIAAASTSATHTFQTHYPKWGTVAAMNDVDAAVPKALTAHQKFDVPVTLQWTFQKGTDFPRVDLRMDLTAATPGQLAFDVRGPYGVIEFADNDGNAVINNVQWGDTAFHFTTQAAANGFLTTASGWVWSEAIGAARPYHAMLAKHSTSGVLYELGLFELKLGGDMGLVYSGYSDNRGTTKAATNHTLVSADFSEGEWPFQSAQYSGLSAASPINGKKFAWGSSSLYGSKATTQFLSATLPAPIVAFPANKQLLYRTCVVFSVSPFTDAVRKGATRLAAESNPPSCATASPL